MSGARRDDERVDEADILVGHARNGFSPLIASILLVVLGVALFLALDERRVARAAQLETTAPQDQSQVMAPPPPLDIPRPRPAPPPPPPPQPQPVVMEAPRPPPPPDDSAQRLHAPAVVVDISSANNAASPSAPAKPDGHGGPPPHAGAETAADAGHAAVNANVQFAAKLSGEDGQSSSIATQMTDLGTTIIQGATIQAVLETAINSDLPGYIRAVVRRDVLGFDGKAVLIPRGSRVIGQYRDALSLGQSRVFVIWTRIIRPDGVSVEIGSPGGDALGEGGLTGDVNTHFFARFSGAILLSVLNAGAGAVARSPSTEIAIGSPAAAMSAAAAATSPQGTNIAPTVKVAQGSAVTIFVARDIDFSSVKPVN